MGYTFSLLLLAIAISLDSFGAGLAYGLRNIKIPLKSIIIIASCTALSLGTAMILGQLIQGFLSPAAANRIGGAILIMIGGWVILQFIRSEREQAGQQEKIEFNWEIKSLGIVIHILKKPTRADFDFSGTVTGIEAFMLGTALSLDAFGVGIGAAMIGFSPIILSGAAAVMGGLFLSGGIAFGGLFAHMRAIQKFTFFPGVLLIVIGLLKM
ncbi:sporulation membrane protein YtaF [Siminovitchia terrae]|uniref:Sporulation membrane protein YtaF n=1 Tax=Siminovitchia terrae TaxID=1914933 RepID=A0A429XAN0_SIMTE|nr:sporulation membrane protein YtaF [Siminovitchia terrae]RST60487.1 sporulation membrane protein YtaF [Siminovitchia terrae]GIN91791.1 sporulation membrane protein YtaF [Siminovitchia terrae]GIN98602.1 sporulation membrane protein YtaF [Siminovitchia terrae]